MVARRCRDNSLPFAKRRDCGRPKITLKEEVMTFRRMLSRNLRRQMTRLAVLGILPLAASGQKPAASPLVNTVQIRVDCGNPTARVKSIAGGLQLLGNLHPAVLLISGTCHENVVIQGLNGITLQGNPTATIDGGSDPNVGTVAIVGSLNISLNNLTMTGGGQGIGCFGVSYCLLNQTTIENSLGDGADVQAAARLDIFDSVIQNNAGAGLGVAGVGAYFGGTISGNGSDGVVLRNGGFFATNPGNVTPGVSIQNNAGDGIRTSLH